jgi:predicted AAA+ superfamily ATPase
VDPEDIRALVERASSYALDEAARVPYRRGLVVSALAELSRGDSRRVVVLDGPRRVGKSTALKQVLAALRADGAPAWYCDLEDRYLSAAGLSAIVDALSPLLDRAPRSWILFDEIHNVEGWPRELKTLVDRRGTIRYAIADSCGALVHREVRERLLGRTLRVPVHPFSLSEILELRTATGLAPLESVADRRDEALRYLRVGGFPEVAMSTEPLPGIYRRLAQDVVDAAIEKDITRAQALRQPDGPRRMLYHLVQSSGDRRSVQRANEIARATTPTTTHWMQAMLDTGIVWELPPYATEKRVRAQPKLYATDPGIVAACSRPSAANDPTFLGRLAETALAQALRSWCERESAELSFYELRAAGESDFVIEVNDGSRFVMEVTAGDGRKKPERVWGLSQKLKSHRAAIVAIRSATDRLTFRASGEPEHSVPVFALHDVLITLVERGIEALPW